MLRAVVFDLDYTLAVPDRDRAAILADAARSVGAPSLSREAYVTVHRRHLTTETREPIFEALLADRNADADPAALATAYRRELADALGPIEGVESMLERLRERYRVGLLTNGPVLAGREKLAVLGWEDAFDAVVVTGELEAGKPDPRAFAAVLDDLEEPPSAAVYVGDELEADLEGAINAGLRAVQVLQPDRGTPDPRADAHVDRSRLATDLPDILAGIE